MKGLVLLLILLPILLVGATLYFFLNKEEATSVTEIIKNQKKPTIALEKKVNSRNASSLVFSNELNDEKLKKISPKSPDNKTVEDIKKADKKESKRSKRATDNRSYMKSYISNTKYYYRGKKEMESVSKGGRLFYAKVWKPNGELCPVTNLSDGNGVVVRYNSWGTQWYRLAYRNGLPIWAA